MGIEQQYVLLTLKHPSLIEGTHLDLSNLTKCCLDTTEQENEIKFCVKFIGFPEDSLIEAIKREPSSILIWANDQTLLRLKS